MGGDEGWREREREREGEREREREREVVLTVYPAFDYKTIMM